MAAPELTAEAVSTRVAALVAARAAAAAAAGRKGSPLALPCASPPAEPEPEPPAPPLLRNMLSLGLAFMVHYIAMKGAINLQSSVFVEQGLGTAALTVYYAGYIASNLVVPGLAIRCLGSKHTMVLSTLLFLPYMAAQLWPRFYTLVPAAFLAGCAVSPMWVAQGVFLSYLARRGAEQTERDALLVRLTGAFYMLYQLSQVWGNLLSSAVLSQGQGPADEPAAHNETGQCGAAFCPLDPASVRQLRADRPAAAHIAQLTAAYAGCMLLAAAGLQFGLDRVPRSAEAGFRRDGSGCCSALLATLRMTARPRVLLLLPITVFLGAQDTFLAADYTAAFVSCPWGIARVGWVMVCYGAANAGASLLGGWAVQLTGRPPVVLGAAVLQAAVAAALLLWRPGPADVLLFFLMAGLWGVCDGLWQAQLCAMFGSLFPGEEEATYTTFRLWEGVGYMLAMGYSAHLCTGLKLQLLLALLAAGSAGFCAVELRLRRLPVKQTPGA